MSIEHVDVLIVGAGLSGIGAGYHLQAECPDKSYAILEARDCIGGTWDLFSYPGIRSDSDMYTLGYSFRPWTEAKALADGPVDPELRPRDRARARHRRAHPLPPSGRARRVVDGGRALDGRGERERHGSNRAADLRLPVRLQRLLPLRRGLHARLPRAPSASTAASSIRSTGPPDIDHAGKRVVVIGSGATAVTLVPALAQSASHVTMLQRSPSYIVSLPAEDPLADGLRRFLPSSSRTASCAGRTSCSRCSASSSPAAGPRS